MSEPFFSVSHNATRLEEVALSWVGTPFHAHGRVRGRNGGITCAGLIFEICRELEVFREGEITIPEGPILWHEHNDISLIAEYFRNKDVRKRVKRVEDEDPAIGDLIALKLKRTEHHLCMMFTPAHIIHCHRLKGVMVASLIDVQKYIGSIYRIFS